jgi:protein O-GlcNAc transferase
MAKKHFSDRAGQSGAQIAQTFRQAMAAHQAGHLAEAESLYKRVLALDKKQSPALQMLGLLNGQLGNLAEAERLFRNALSINPNDPRCHFNQGNALFGLQRFDEALAAFDKALALNPGFAVAHLNRGSILLQCKRFEDARASYDSAITANPNYAAAYCNRGNALEQLNRFAEALASADKALAIEPGNAEFHASRSNILHRLGRFDDALVSVNQALAISPDKAEFHDNRGNILSDLKRHDEAFAAYEQAFRLKPDLEYVEGNRLFAKMLICNWSNLDAEASHLVAGVTAGKPVTRPFTFLAVPASPAAQTKCAQLFMDHEFPPARPLWTGQRYRHDRIRLAYLSADFREHPVSHLLAGMFERHDRKRFETIAVSFGAANPSKMRKRLENAFERFIDVRDKSDADVAKLLHDGEVDIAIDLMGPTQHARPAILAHRPAPIQGIYLGYAGSSGAEYIDYLIADRVVIPQDERQFYREKVVYLPDTFMGTDATRKIADRTPSRAQQGLPETGIVFCSFNNSYKITRAVFDMWMRLLRALEGSVLWLSRTNDSAVTHLQREAQARNVAADRLVFARRVELNEDHLARYRLADLFLDTLPFGGHSTASEALWAGVPVVTCLGSTYSERVAASLLNAVGLPELVADSLPAYEALALKLARNSELLASVRAKLARNRDCFPLFDTERFTRHLEAAYANMWERYQRAEPPAHITVAALPG